MSTMGEKTWPATDYVSESTINLLEDDRGAPPKIAWRRKLNNHANFLREFNVTFTEAVKMIKLGYRLWAYNQEERSQGRTPPIDPFSRQIRASACHGVPLGGMGSGSIGRGFRGEFRRWQLLPGVCEEGPVLANQFSVFISRDNGKKFSSVLYPGRPTELGMLDDASIASWDWNLDGQHSTYHAVFPRAWTIYDGEPDPELKISCRQISPFIPNNYRESCLPATVFSYTLVNTGNDNAIVTLAFTWMNSIGGQTHFTGGHFNECFMEDDGVGGVLLHHKYSKLQIALGRHVSEIKILVQARHPLLSKYLLPLNKLDGENCEEWTSNGNPPITFAIAAQMTDEAHISVFPCFSTLGNDNQEFSAQDMWMEIKEHGMFNGKHWDSFPTGVSQRGGAIGGAVAATIAVPAHQKRTVTFSLVWDSPKVKFLKGRSYYRRYTKFYGFSGKAATRLAHDALLEFPRWESEIARWQKPILEDVNLPEWYRFTLFNELYFLVAGGTVWTESEAANLKGESLGQKILLENTEAGTDSDGWTRTSAMLYSEKNTIKDTDEGQGDIEPSLMTDETEDLEIHPSQQNSLQECDDKAQLHVVEREVGESQLNDKKHQVDTNDLETGLNSGKTEVESSQILNQNSAVCSNEMNREETSGDIVGYKETMGIETIAFQNISTQSQVSDNVVEFKQTSLKVMIEDVAIPPEDDGHDPDNDKYDDVDNVGRFLYLEGLEYVMWCTYDVHFYASFALLELFPKLELSIQQQIADATMTHNPEKTKFLTEADWGIRKVLGAVPHDLGMHDPWFEVNAYNIHDTSKWKDLNCKFVLQVYRDFVATQDLIFAEKTLPAVFTAMAYMDKFDKDRDGLIENDGFADQTYDAWTVHGISAYCGGLWLGALQAAAAMAEKLNHDTLIESFRSKFLQARDVYEKKLWNGSYFNYDSGTSSNSNSIQADQLAGQLYMFASGLPPLFEEEKIKTILKKIYEFNVMKVKEGKLGAVNGMHPNGKVDETCMQSREIWTGVTYALAATMIHAGMVEEAFHTAEGIFCTGWSEEGFGYWFQTPEGWTVNGHFRSLAYMRPLAIWAMQHALNMRNASNDGMIITPMYKENIDDSSCAIVTKAT